MATETSTYQDICQELTSLGLYEDVKQYIFQTYSLEGTLNRIFKDLYGPHIQEHMEYLSKNPLMKPLKYSWRI